MLKDKKKVPGYEASQQEDFTQFARNFRATIKNNMQLTYSEQVAWSLLVGLWSHALRRTEQFVHYLCAIVYNFFKYNTIYYLIIITCNFHIKMRFKITKLHNYPGKQNLHEALLNIKKYFLIHSFWIHRWILEL